MDGRTDLIWNELKQQCQELKSYEFEFYWEVWGVSWMPWFIEVNNNSLKFTVNDISMDDLKILTDKGYIEIIKIYDKTEMTDEFGKIRYRITPIKKSNDENRF